MRQTQSCFCKRTKLWHHVRSITVSNALHTQASVYTQRYRATGQPKLQSNRTTSLCKRLPILPTEDLSILLLSAPSLPAQHWKLWHPTWTSLQPGCTSHSLVLCLLLPFLGVSWKIQNVCPSRMGFPDKEYSSSFLSWCWPNPMINIQDFIFWTIFATQNTLWWPHWEITTPTQLGNTSHSI